MPLVRLGRYQLTSRTVLVVQRGSVLDFGSRGDAAIVNAANEGCLGGGGVDGAISTAGGERLFRARLALPVVRGESIRCPTGDARINGPGRYGSIRTNHVIHAVGPNYNAFFLSEYEEADGLLASAYRASLERAQENQLNQVAFCLLSAGLFKGSRTLQQVLEIGVEAIHTWVKKHPDTSIQFIHMCAFTRKEALTLLHVMKEITADDGEEEEAKDDGDDDEDENSEDEIDVGGETQPSYLPSDGVDIVTEKNTETIEEENDGENAKDQNGAVTTSDEDADAAVDQQNSEATDDGAIKTETKDSAATTLEEETATKTKPKEAEEDHPMDEDDDNERTADNIQDTTKPTEEKAEGEDEENSAEKSVETNVANTADEDDEQSGDNTKQKS